MGAAVTRDRADAKDFGAFYRRHLDRVLASCVQRTGEPASSRIRFPAVPPRVISGVVRDGIASLDVYAHTRHGESRILTGVPIHANVYSFESGGAVTWDADARVQGPRGPSPPDHARPLRHRPRDVEGNYRVSLTATVIRVTAHSLPVSSQMRTSHTHVVRPWWRTVASA